MRRASKKMHQKLKGRRPHPKGARRWLDKAIGEIKLPKGIVIEPVEIGKLKGEWLVPPKITSQGALLYLHGGGYYFGSMKSHRPLAAKLAEVTGMKILHIDYRLAPEDPYPAALEDAMAAFQWIQDTTQLSAQDIFIAGDSAGSGLALCSAMTLRDQGLLLPRALVLLSPWLDLSCSLESYTTNEEHDPMFSTQYVSQVGEYYAKNIPLNDPRVSPVFADVSGL